MMANCLSQRAARCQTIQSSRHSQIARPCRVSAQKEAQRSTPAAITSIGQTCSALALSFVLIAGGASARPEPVNRPDLLPEGGVTPMIDVANFLTKSEEAKIVRQISDLEQDTGIKLRVLAQNYPDTPGLAIKDYWGIDANTVVLVADPTFGDMLNFNVGQDVDLSVPQSFWSRLAGKYGNKFYMKENGREASIMNAVSAINTCLREPPGRLQCSTIQGDFGEEPTSGKVGNSFAKFMGSGNKDKF